RFFEEEGEPGDTIVVDGGRTIKEFVLAVPERLFEDVKVIPLCADPPSDESSAYELMTRLCQKLNAQPKKVPYYHSSLLDPEHKKINMAAEKARFVMLGVGAFQEVTSTPHDFIKHLG